MSSGTISASARRRSTRSKRNTGGTRRTTTRLASPKRHLGQHFLEPAWVTKVVDAIAPSADDRFLEIGPGRGALTWSLAETGARVVGVEVDPRLAAELCARAPSTVHIQNADFLAIDVAGTVRQLAGAGARRRPIRIVGNLPYNVSAPILLEVLRVGSQEPVDDAIFMLQREVADRVTAKPGSASYGPLAVMTALRARATRVLSLPPGAFRPMPRVRSALVALRFRRPERAPADLPRFESMVRALFTQRRKQTGNALAAFAGAAGVDPVASCDRAGLDPRRRPGELTLSELIDLSEVLASGPR